MSQKTSVSEQFGKEEDTPKGIEPARPKSVEPEGIAAVLRPEGSDDEADGRTKGPTSERSRAVSSTGSRDSSGERVGGKRGPRIISDVIPDFFFVNVSDRACAREEEPRAIATPRSRASSASSTGEAGPSKTSRKRRVGGGGESLSPLKGRGTPPPGKGRSMSRPTSQRTSWARAALKRIGLAKGSRPGRKQCCHHSFQGLLVAQAGKRGERRGNHNPLPPLRTKRKKRQRKGNRVPALLTQRL